MRPNVFLIEATMQEEAGAEKRSLKRLEPYYYLRVFDGTNREYVGSVVDISKKGMRLISERPFTVKAVYNFRMPLPEDSIFGNTMSIEARACWSKSLEGSNGYETGFEFEKPVNDGVIAIGALIKDLERQHLI
jgi:hypothetical protein